MNLGEHPFVDRASLDHPLHVLPGERGHMTPLCVANTLHIREHQQFLGLEGSRHCAGDQVRINIVGTSSAIRPDRGDDRNKIVLLQLHQQVRIHRLHLAHQSKVFIWRPLQLRAEAFGPGFRGERL